MLNVQNFIFIIYQWIQKNFDLINIPLIIFGIFIMMDQQIMIDLQKRRKSNLIIQRFFSSDYMIKNNMINCLTHIALHMRTLLRQSGHSIFSYGHYQDCLETPDFTYNLLGLGIGNNFSGIFMGMCLPKQCTHKIVETAVSQTLTALQLPYNVYSLETTIQNYQYPFTWVFFLVCIIMLLFALLVCLGSLLKQRLPSLKGFDLKQSLKIFKRNQSSDLNILNGIRSLAMMWVVLGHYYLNSATGVLNTMYFSQIFKKPFFLIIQAGLISVDVFFFLGGFFLSFVFMRERSQSILKYPMAVLQRILRIWPAYILTMMIYYGVYMHTGGGPRWKNSNEQIVNICQSMWRSIFFVENIIDNGEEICLGWGWYLQVDFQIFLGCIVILFLYQKSKLASYLLTGGLMLFSFLMNILWTQKQNQKLFTDVSDLANIQSYFLNVYIKPHTRCVPYLMGLFVGIYFFDYQKQMKDVKIIKSTMTLQLCKFKLRIQKDPRLRWLVQWFGIGLMAFIVFIPRTLQQGHQWAQAFHSFYLCFSKPIFIIGMLMVLLPSLLGIKDSFFKTLLDTSLFNMMAKISFCTYLIHLMVISQFCTSRTDDIYYTIKDGFILYVGCLTLSCALGFIMTIFVEIPCSYYQKQLMKNVQNWRKIDNTKTGHVSAQSQNNMRNLLINKSTQSEEK